MILVIGDIMLDRYWFCDTIKHNSVTINSKTEYPGGAANVANNIATLGTAVVLCGLTADDPAKRSLLNLLNPLVTTHLANTSEKTIIKLRILAAAKQLIRIDFENDPNIQKGILPEFLLNFPEMQNILNQTKVLILSDYGKGALNNIAALISFFIKYYPQIKILVDPKGNDFRKYEQVYLIKPNLQEFQAIVGPCNFNNLDIKAKEFLNEYNIENLLITLGKHGMVLYQRSTIPMRIKAIANEIFDVTGAGDTVLASIAYALDKNLDLQQALQLANQTAALAVAKVGTVNINLEDLQSFKKDQLKATLLIPRSESGMRIQELNKNNQTVYIYDKPFALINNKLITEFQNLKKNYNLLWINLTQTADNDPYFSVKNKIAILKALKSVDGIVI